jgi:ribonuclease HI
MEVAVVLRGVVHLFEDPGIGSNSDAEWLALIRALELAQSLGLTNVELIGDAVEVIGKANAALSNGRELAGRAATFLSLAASVRPVRIRWIKRAQNLAGIALAARHPR